MPYRTPNAPSRAPHPAPSRPGPRDRDRRDRDRRDRGRRDRGQVAIEYLGFLPVLLLVAMAAVQLGLIAYTAQQAGTAARAGARSASLDQAYGSACTAAVSDWLADGTSCAGGPGGDEVTVTATVEIPSIVPGWNFDPARKTATMPLDH
ncbi:TadE/TadG family type IV pilus assembly protein [Streptomyces capillispiralis]|uniref:TadE/TadG family type IV pilus assembly protein n=1 Tax=Streptomyces capillispiralis TaxID=68182 RepID=UPI00367367C4